MRDAVFAAVAQLILTEGAGAVTALRVSKRAGVARSTIYEHWPTSEDLVLDAIDRVIAQPAATTVTADLGADLVRVLTGLRDRLERKPFRIWFATLLDHGNRDPAFAEAQIRFVTGVLRSTIDVVAAAKDRGELDHDLDATETAAQLAAPIFTQHVLLRSTASDDQIADTVARYLTGHPTNTTT